MTALELDVVAAFAEGGPLARSTDGLRPRPAQLDMASAVARTVDARDCLVVEAGTGVGKTFAYLVPVLLSGRRALLSTATQALQDQLFSRDIPAVSRALGVPVRAALLKGRSSYLCHHRLDQARLTAQLPDRWAVRQLARQLGVDLGRLAGSGTDGLITRADVEAATQTARDRFGGEKLRGVRRSMAINMARAHAEVVPVVIVGDADLHLWAEARDPLVRLAQAIAAACRVEPLLNSWFDGKNLSLKQHEQLDLGIAVDSPDGLFVPVLRNVGARSAEDLKAGAARLRADVKARSIPPQEMMGATLTLSNFGTLFGRYANPIVMPPQVAIIGAGGIRDEPVAVKGKVEVHPILPLSLTFDHRAVTGGEAARFLKALVQALEQREG